MIQNDSYALIPANQQLAVGNYFVRLSDVLNKTGLYNYLKENELYQQSKDSFTKAVVGLVEGRLNKNYHESLNVIEKLGFFTSKKDADHRNKVGLMKGGTVFTIQLAAELLPKYFDKWQRDQQALKLADFATGAMAYINKTSTMAQQSRVIGIHKKLGTQFEVNHYNDVYSSYCTLSDLGSLYGLVSNLDNSEAYELFNFILPACDLQNVHAKTRCEEVAEDYFSLNREDVSKLILMTKDNQGWACDVAAVAGLSINTVLADIAASYNHAKQYASYSIDNDPYELSRQRNKKIVLGVGSVAVPLMLGQMDFATGAFCQELISLSRPIVGQLLNESADVDTNITIVKQMKSMGNAQ